MISQVYQVSSSKSFNIGTMSSPKIKQKFSFTPQPHSVSHFNLQDENSNSIQTNTPAFVNEKIAEEPDSSEDEYAGLKSKEDNSDENSSSHSPKSRKRNSTLDEQFNEIIKSLNNSPKISARKISNINNETLIQYKKKLSKLLDGNCGKGLQKRKSISSLYILPNEEELAAMSSMKEISNFYEYTKNCFKTMIELEKITKVNKCTPLTFPFDDEIGHNKKLAIFDLDETLIHCMVKKIQKPHHIIEITLPSKKKGKIGLNIRPHWKEALDTIKERYEIVVYTASHKSYCDAILDFMDPDNVYFKYRLYRNNCTSVKYEGSDIYIKDLSIFKNIDLKNIIIIDNSVISFTYNLDNGLPILPYYDSDHDYELIFLTGYLNFIFEFEDLREANKLYVKLDYYKSMAIKKNFDFSLSANYSHQSTNCTINTECSKKDNNDYDNNENNSIEMERKDKRNSSIFSSQLKDTIEELRTLFLQKNK